MLKVCLISTMNSIKTGFKLIFILRIFGDAYSGENNSTKAVIRLNIFAGESWNHSSLQNTINTFIILYLEMWALCSIHSAIQQNPDINFMFLLQLVCIQAKVFWYLAEFLKTSIFLRAPGQPATKQLIFYTGYQLDFLPQAHFPGNTLV